MVVCTQSTDILCLFQLMYRPTVIQFCKEMLLICTYKVQVWYLHDYLRNCSFSRQTALCAFSCSIPIYWQTALCAVSCSIYCTVLPFAIYLVVTFKINKRNIIAGNSKMKKNFPCELIFSYWACECLAYTLICLAQRFTNPGHHVTITTKFSTLAPRNLRWLLDDWNICAQLV